MKIALVGPSPVPFTFGGVEGLLASLREQIGAATAHQVELIKLPVPERSFWEVVDGYRRFWSLDLGHFDLVISLKYPAWMVRHPRHVCYMTHRLRGLYDTYQPPGARQVLPRGIPAVGDLLAFMARCEGSDAEIDEFFSLVERLRTVPPEHLEHPGPLMRRIVHFLDDQALSPKRIQRFFAISRVVAERRGYFPPDVPVGVLPPPSRLTGFRDTGAKHLFTTSRLDGPKRLGLLIQAMRLAKARVPLKIAGTGPEEPRLRALAAGDDRIEFLGFVSDDALLELYGDALGVPFVPYEEDYGLVTIEAMMSRKPVITCVDSGGPLEFVVDGETGFVAGSHPNDVADRIDRLAGDPERAASMGRRGYDRVQGITWETTVRALLDEKTRARGAGRPARPRLTVAVPFPVFPPMGGGQQRLFSLFRHMTRAFDVEFVTLTAPGSPVREMELAPGVREIRVPRSARHHYEECQLGLALPGLPISDIATALFVQHTPEYVDRLGRSVAGAAVIVASHPYCLPAIRAVQGRQRLVYEAQDVEYRLKREVLAKWGAVGAELAELVRDLEAEACHASRLVLCCSDDDATELATLYGVSPARIAVVPNGADVEAIRFTSPADRQALKTNLGLGDAPLALFVGSWHPPNLDAAEAIFEIARASPEVSFLLVGSHCTALAERARPRNVALMGAVDDDTLASLLACADVALNPMRIGSGTNLKILTYLAAGVPVVTTPFGARGIALVDGESASIAPLERFPERIAALTRGSSLAEHLSSNGRRLVEERYDWRVIAARAVDAIRSVPIAASLGGAVGTIVEAVAAGVVEMGVPENCALVGDAARAVQELLGAPAPAALTSRGTR